MRVACFWFSEPRDLASFAEDCLRFTPQICLREEEAIFLEIGKCYRLYSEEKFLLLARRLLDRLGVEAEIALADSLEGALVAAKFGTLDFTKLPLEALFDWADPLRGDPKALPFVTKLIDALPQLGIRNLAAFRALPRRELASRFGPVGLLCRQRLDGDLIFPWKAWVPPEVIEEIATYMYADVPGSLEPLLFEAKKLLDRLFTRLRTRGLKAAALQVHILCEKVSVNPDRERDLPLEFLLPQGDTKGALAILREFFAKEFDRKPLLSAVERFAIRITKSVPATAGQKNLYHGREERREAMDKLLSQMAEAYGKGAVFQALTVEERLPEYSWEKRAKLEGAGACLKGRVPLRPTNLVKPKRIEVTAGTIYISKKPFRIKIWSEAVEQISARWLSGLVDRKYFQVEVEEGPLLWLYQDEQKNYFLHGFYG